MSTEFTTLAAVKLNANIDGTASDDRITPAVTAVNAWMESYIGTDLLQGGGTVTTARATDIPEANKMVHIPYGFQGVATLEYAQSSRAAMNGDYTTIAATEYVLRGPAGQPAAEAPAGWPYFRVHLLPDSTPGYFPAGYGTVRITPSGGWGWAAVPADLSRVAAIAALRMFQSSQSGEALAIGSTDFGAAIIRFLPEPEYQAIIERYRTVINPSWSG